jgi:AraC family transcriptional regulator of arabinose operon
MQSMSSRIFPNSRCPFPIPNPRSEIYRPSQDRGNWSLITGFYRVADSYGVLRDPGAREHILFHTTGGSGFVVTPGGWMPATGDRSIFIEPGTPHYYATHPEAGFWHFHWVHFFPPPHWTSLLEVPMAVPGLRSADLSGETPGEVSSALASAHALRQQPVPKATALAMNALERALLWIAVAGGRAKPLDSRILRAVEIILAHPEQSHPVAGLARRAGLSPSRFAHLFREETGQTPQQYYEGVRLHLASEWLRAGGRSVGEIADALGFSSAFYFSRRFKARFGTSPTHYRLG